mgnify:FL=1
MDYITPIKEKSQSNWREDKNEGNSLSTNLNTPKTRTICEIDQNINHDNSSTELVGKPRFSPTKSSLNSVLQAENSVKELEQCISALIEKMAAERNHLIQLGVIRKQSAGSVPITAEKPSPTNKSRTPEYSNKFRNQENIDPSQKELNTPTTYLSNIRTVKTPQHSHSKQTHQKSAASTIRSLDKTFAETVSQYTTSQKRTTRLDLENNTQSHQISSYLPPRHSDSNFAETIKPKALVPTVQAEKVAKPATVYDLISIDRAHFDFGTTLPGQIFEEALTLVNKSKEKLIVAIELDCLNPELKNADEYTFALRQKLSRDYNHRHFVVMPPESRTTFMLALKSPSLKIKEQIRSETKFSIQGVDGYLLATAETKQVIPKLSCPKELYDATLRLNVIKLAVKRNKKFETRIPFDNKSNIPLTLSFDFFKTKDCNELVPFECRCYPSSMTIEPNSSGSVSVVLSPTNELYQPEGNKTQCKAFTKILMAKVRNTGLTYTFVLSMEIY